MASIYPIREDQVWRRAKKTAQIKAKPMISLLVDRTVASMFLVDTLEGREPLSMGNMFCIGAASEPWQQSAKALLKKYEVTNVDDEGWMHCTPRPENEIQFFQFNTTLGGINSTDWVIQGLWGETIYGVENLQRVKKNDFICRQPYDHNDVWVVRHSLFVNTYSVLGEDS